jgi:hypothetical protein
MFRGHQLHVVGLWFISCQLMLAARPGLIVGPTRDWLEDFLMPPVLTSECEHRSEQSLRRGRPS